MNNPTGEQELVAALKRLAQETDVPAADPQLEQDLLDAFDAAWQQRQREPLRSPRYLPAAAALLALAATIAWMVARGPAEVVTPPTPTVVASAKPIENAAPWSVPAPTPRNPAAVTTAARTHRARPRTPPPPAQTAVEFVAWPGATRLPTFESGYLMRVDMPVSIVLSLGLVPQMPQATFVQTDVLVGQDRLPRAVRLVP